MERKYNNTNKRIESNENIKQLVQKACDFLKVDIDYIKSNKKNSYLVDARRMLSGLLYYENKYRLTKKEIGHFMGNRCHSTIITQLNTLKTICETEIAFKQMYQDLHIAVYGSTKYCKY